MDFFLLQKNMTDDVTSRTQEPKAGGSAVDAAVIDDGFNEDAGEGSDPDVPAAATSRGRQSVARGNAVDEVSSYSHGDGASDDEIPVAGPPRPVQNNHAAESSDDEF